MMTVGELVDHLASFGDDVEVILSTDPFEWREIKKLDPPLANPEDRVQKAVCIVGSHLTL